ncbi:META domain-containing protein [Intrasporangium sp. DVR]|uniref:META domain-containing protein n=1 Tax=Intrasporangium sp. DVR TaxID=3127867 RepID=UPI00313A56B8
MSSEPAGQPATRATRATRGWTVESIAGLPTTDPKPEIALTEDGRVEGTTGVNRITGTYEAHDETVRVEGVGMTRRAGSPEAMDQERRFLQALEGWNAFHVRDGRLELGAPGTGLVCSMPPPPEA